MTVKERLHQAVEEMSDEEAEAMLRRLDAQRDPLVRFLDEAPIDDEPVSDEEESGAREAWAEYRRGESTPIDELRHEAS